MFDVYAQSTPLGAGDPARLSQLEEVFSNVVAYILPLAGLTLLIFILHGGFQMITSGENPDKLEAAKNTITYAIYGIILIALAYLIIVILAEFTGVDALKQFQIRA